ncbi:MAG TPA: hybrid sensor histidine kinase/response regulator [Actinomycetota bacterium]
MSDPNDELLRELLSVFVAEADERLHAIDAHLLELERTGPDGREELFARIMREVHTLKGSAGAVNLDDVSTVAHELETYFGLVRDGVLPTDPETVDVAYRALDAIRELVAAGAESRPSGVDVSALCAELVRARDARQSAASDDETRVVAAAVVEPIAAQPKGDPAADAPAPRDAPAPQEIPKPSPASAPAPSSTPARTTEETVRVATAKLDGLMAQVGELLVGSIGASQRISELRALSDELTEWTAGFRKSRSQFRRLLQMAESDAPEVVPFLLSTQERIQQVHTQVEDLRRRLEADDRRMTHVTNELQDEVRRTRMLPVATVFDAFPRMARDLARDLGKEVALEVRGGEIEVDRPVLEQIRAPLTHLLRNCLDHGLEAPEVRLKAGKPREGRVRMSAFQRGGSLLIEVADDGGGIDPGRVRSVAVARGVVPPEAARGLTDRESLRLIFRSGFSTSSVVTDVSGRGVGLDVVRESVERLHGMIEVESRIGAGTTFSLTLPVTVATTQCLLVRVGAHTFGLPITSVSRILRLAPGAIRQAQGRDVVSLDGEPVTVTSLAHVLQVPLSEEPDQGSVRTAVLLRSADRHAALLVDSLAGAQEVVIKSLPRPMVRVRHVVGATILGSGDVVVILNAADVVRSSAGSTARRRTAAATQTPAQREARSGVVLVADDSMVTRMLEKSILEAAGYRVLVASDGTEAWSILDREPCDLLVSDVNMPRMDGLELTAKLRGDERFKSFPVVLVTSLDSSDDHARGIEAGADAYIVKSEFSQQGLLETISRLI